MPEPVWLEGPRLKIGRAREQIVELESAIQAHHDAGALELTAEPDDATDELVYRVRVRKELPMRITTIIGDAIHNARSALDLLICDLVRKNGHSVHKSNAFPIATTKGEFERAIPSRLRDVPAKAIALIRRLKPYDGGNPTLWKLSAMDNLHKHEMLLPIAAGQAVTRLQISIPFLHLSPGGFSIGGPHHGSSPLGTQWGWMTPDGAPFLEEVTDNAIVYRSKLVRAGLNETVDFQAQLMIDRTDRTDLEPVAKLLPSAVDYVEKIVSIVDRKFG